MLVEPVSTYSTILKGKRPAYGCSCMHFLLTCVESQQCVLLNSICQQSSGEEISTQQIKPAAAPALLASELIRSSLFVEAVSCSPKTKPSTKLWLGQLLTHFDMLALEKHWAYWEVESWAGSTNSLYNSKAAPLQMSPSAVATSQPDWWNCFFPNECGGPGSLGCHWLQQGTGVKAVEACYWFQCEWLCKGKPDSQRVGACRAIPVMCWEPWGGLFPALSHVLALVGKESRIMYVS